MTVHPQKERCLQPLNLRRTEIPLIELLKMYESGEFRLPAFQRPFVWKTAQTLNLLDSLLRGYPISVVYLWEPGANSSLRPKKQKAFRSKAATPQVDKFKAYIIDGQQRIVATHAAYGFAEAFDHHNGRSLECWLELVAHDSRDGRVTKLFQSPARKAFLEDPASQQLAKRVSLRELRDTPHQAMREDRQARLMADDYSDEEIKTALGRIDAAYEMLRTPVTCITITQSEDEQVLEVFKRLNRGGTGLKERDVRAADLGIGKSVDVLEDIQSFVSQPLPTALAFGFPFAFRGLVVFHKGTAQFSNLPLSWADTAGDRGQTLRESWKEAQKGLEAAMALVDEMGWSRKPLLPSCNALIPLALSLNMLDRSPNQAEREVVTRWFCLAALRGVFQGGVETTINRHLRKIADARNPIDGLMDALTAQEKRPISAGELSDQITSLWGPFSQVLFAWLVSLNAKDWLTGEPLDKVARLALKSRQPEETLSIQHIFPRKVLADRYQSQVANYPANFGIIAQSSNSSFKDLPPLEALQRLDSHEKRERARMQMFGQDAAGMLAPDRYDEFVDWRSKRLAEAWNRWLGLK